MEANKSYILANNLKALLIPILGNGFLGIAM